MFEMLAQQVQYEQGSAMEFWGLFKVGMALIATYFICKKYNEPEKKA